MDVIDGTQMKGGWFVGDFEPTAYKTKDFEVAYKFHYKEKFGITIIIK